MEEELEIDEIVELLKRRFEIYTGSLPHSQIGVGRDGRMPRILTWAEAKFLALHPALDE